MASGLGRPNPAPFGSIAVHAAPASRTDTTRCPRLKTLVIGGRRLSTLLPSVIPNAAATAAGTGPNSTMAGMVTTGPNVVAPPWGSGTWVHSAATASRATRARREAGGYSTGIAR